MRDGLIKTLGRRMLTPLLGRPGLQPLFQDMYEVALAGMGYGEGANPAASGEGAVLDYVRSRLDPKSKAVMFDVGANVGLYAAEVLERWHDQLDLRCFEPSPATFLLLSDRLVGDPRVTLENFGLSDANTTLTLHTLGAGSKIASVYRRQTGQWDLDKTEQVEVRTLDSYCSDDGVERIDYLKLDVEGHELSVLRGGERMLQAGAIHFIQFEFSAACIDARVFFKDYWDLLNPGYVLYRVITHGLTPVRAYDETREVFKRATNYLAERR